MYKKNVGTTGTLFIVRYYLAIYGSCPTNTNKCSVMMKIAMDGRHISNKIMIPEKEKKKKLLYTVSSIPVMLNPQRICICKQGKPRSDCAV